MTIVHLELRGVGHRLFNALNSYKRGERHV